MKGWFARCREETAPAPFTAELAHGRRDVLVISICIVTYNRAALLREAVEAALRQCTEAVEVLVIDDGSTDETAAYLASISHPRLRWMRHERNLSRPVARNRAVAEARGRFIYWLDDDDLPREGAIDTYLAFIRENRNLDVAYSDLQIVDLKSGKPQNVLSADDYGGSKARVLQGLIQGRGITSGGSLIRRELFRTVDGYDERFARAQDYEFWFRAASRAVFRKIPKTTYTYRCHRDSASASLDCDRSFESLAIRENVRRYSLSEIFPELNWRDTAQAKNHACASIARGLMKFHDFYNAARFLEQCGGVALDPAIFSLLYDCCLRLGRFEACQGLLFTAADRRWALSREQCLERRERLDKVRTLAADAGQRAERGTTAEARAALRALRSAVGFCFPYAYGAGLVFIRLGDRRRAVRMLLNALDLNPADPDAFKLLLAIASSDRERETWTERRRRWLGQDDSSPLYLIDFGAGGARQYA